MPDKLYTCEYSLSTGQMKVLLGGLLKGYTREYSETMSVLLTTAEAAARLGVTRWRVNALIRDGRLKATRMGQIFIINERDLKSVENRKPGRPPKAKPKTTAKPARKRGGNR